MLRTDNEGSHTVPLIQARKFLMTHFYPKKDQIMFSFFKQRAST